MRSKTDNRRRIRKKERNTELSELFASRVEQKTKQSGVREIESTQRFSRIADIKDGFIITKDGHYICIMEIMPVNYALMCEDEQSNVIHQFHAALKALPKNVQFKVICRKPNVDGRIEHMLRPLYTEPNANCRDMLIEQAALIKAINDTSGVSRRFFVSFEYEADEASLISRLSDTKARWDEVRSQLERQRNQFDYALRGCGNYIKSVPTNECTLRMIYDIMHPYTSSGTYEDMDARVQMALNNHIGKGAYISPNDVLAYQSVNTKAINSIAVDGGLYTCAYIPSSGYPEQVEAGWIASLVGLGDGVDIDIFIRQANQELARKRVQYALRFAMAHDKDVDTTSSEKVESGRKINAGFYLQNRLADENDKLCDICTFITLYASNESELKDKCTRLKRYCDGINIPIAFCRFEQESAFRSVIPPLCNLHPNLFRKARRNIMLSDAVAFYPFLSFELDDPDGILYGTNRTNNSLAIVDNFMSERYSNGNMIICGQSGAGKTYTLSCLCLRLREQGIQTFLIAPVKGWEFKRTCDAIGGQYVRIWPGSADNINVMEIRIRDNTAIMALDGREESQLALKIQSLHTFFAMLLPTIDEEETQALDEALVRTYARFGIFEDNESLKNEQLPGRYKRMPILGDLMDTLNQMDSAKAGRLRAVLTRFVTGSAKSFNAPTNVNLGNKFIALDISQASDDMKALCTFIATDFVWDKCQEDRTARKVIALDEVWQFVGGSASQEVAKFVLRIFKLIRGCGGIGIASTQDISDFFSSANGEFGKAIVNSCEIKCILKLKPNEAAFASQVIELTQQEVEMITREFNRGDMLLMAGTNNVVVHVEASPTEHRVITTNRKDLEAEVKKIIATNNKF